MRKAPHIWTQEQKDFVKEHYTSGKYSRKEVAELINKKFNLDLTDLQIKSIARKLKIKSGRTGQFEKGCTVWNKGMKGLQLGGEAGWFKKGQTPLNYREIGSERICSKDGYVLIKVANDGPFHKRWRHKHQVIWEKHNGPIPDNHVVIILDGNKQNLTIDNLALISRKDLLNMNRHKLFTGETETTKSSVLVAKIYSKLSDLTLKKGDKEDEKR